MSTPGPWLTVPEVVAALRVHPEVVRRWLRLGRLRGVKVGGAWRVARAALPRPAGSGAPLNVLEGRVRRLEVRAGLAWVDTGGELLAVKAAGVRRGQRLRVHVDAEGILVARRPLRGVSARNQWRGVVSTLVQRRDGVEVHVDTRPPLVAWMTPAAVAELRLRPGSTVVLVFKVGTCRVHPLGTDLDRAKKRP